MAEKKRKLTATLPDGEILTRTTHHDYKFVAVGQTKADSYYGKLGHAGRWNVFGWTSREDLGLKLINNQRRWDAYENMQLIPVTEAG